VGDATVVVWHAQSDRVLVDDDALPVLEFAQAWPPMDSALADAAGHGAILLEPLGYTTAVLAATEPADGHWEPAETIHGQLDVVDAWLDRRRQPRMQPWFRPEWFAETDAWLDGIVSRTGPSRQIKQWGVSAVLRTPTTTGDVYTKAVLPELGREPAVTQFLAERAGPPFVRILTVDGLRWVAEDFGGAPPEPAALRRMVAIQHSTINFSRVLTEHGCPLVDLVPEVTPADLRPRLLACAERLVAYDLPATVLHRDLHPGNVVQRLDGVLVHDWSFASIGPPLLDLGSWLWDLDDDAARVSTEAFFDEWSRVVDPAVMRNAWADAKPLSALAELAKFVGLTELVGPAGAFAFSPVVRGWEARLRRALANPEMPGWGD
jgi:hypothetical protein